MCGIEDMLPMMHEMQHFNQIAKRIANIRLTIILYQPRSFVRYSFGVHPIDSRKIFPAAEKDLRLGHAVGNAGLDIVTAP